MLSPNEKAPPGRRKKLNELSALPKRPNNPVNELPISGFYFRRISMGA
jgi:hypothetical protein